MHFTPALAEARWEREPQKLVNKETRVVYLVHMNFVSRHITSQTPEWMLELIFGPLEKRHDLTVSTCKM